jgi:hypothetical protein
MFTSARICIFSRRTSTSFSCRPGVKEGLWEDLGTIHRTNDRYKDLHLADCYAVVGTVAVREILEMIPLHHKKDFLEETEYDMDDRVCVLSFNGNAVDASRFASFKKWDEPYFTDLWIDGNYAILFGT